MKLTAIGIATTLLLTSLVVAAPAATASHDCASATTLTSAAGTGSGTIHSPYTYRYYRTYVEAGNQLVVQLLLPQTLDFNIHYTKSPGTCSFSSIGDTINFRATTSGYYYFAIHAHASGGEYRFAYAEASINFVQT